MAQQKNGGQDDGAESWGIIAIILFGIVYFAFSQIFWVFAGGWKWVRIIEVGAFSYIVPDFIQSFMAVSFNQGLEFLLQLESKDITADFISEFDNNFVYYFNAIPAILIGWAGVKIFMQAEDVSTNHDMESMLLKMSRAFPHNNQFIGKHPEQTPLDFYPEDPDSYEFTMCMSERQFASIVPPLGLMKRAEKDKRLAKPIWDGAKGFDDELARMSFETQMGPVYRGYNYLSPDEKTLTDLFRNKILVKRVEVFPIMKNYAYQIYEFRKSSKAFVDQKKQKSKKESLPKPEVKYIAEFSSHKALVEKLTGYVDSSLAKHGHSWSPKDVELRNLISSKDYKSILRHVMADDRLSKHAYTYTGLMSLLLAAREGGTLAPSTFRWLKGRNRTLWFALNCVGKKVAYTESSGTFAHWLLETHAKIAIPHPEVTEAIEALRISLGLKEKHASSDSLDDWG